MTLNIALQIDRPETLLHDVDTSLAIAREANKRGHALFYLNPDTVGLDEGEVVGTLAPFNVQPAKSDPVFSVGKLETKPLHTMNAVLIRQNPPIDMAYLSNMLFLERLEKQGTLVLNRPASIRDFPEKLIPLQFSEFTPPTLISHDAVQVRAFYHAHGEVVIKPLYGYGGKSIFKLSKDGSNVEAILETLFEITNEPFVVQKFLPEVTTEEKRIILIDGKFAGAFGRIPAEGDIRTNMRVGGTPVGTTLSKKQEQITNAVGEFAKAHGFLLVGLDVIGDWLTEVNVTSPTGFVALQTLYGTDPAVEFMDAMEKLIQ